MWLLQRKSDGKVLYLLNKEYIVGRNKNDPSVTILITQDDSMSRKHLKLKAEYSHSQDSVVGILQVMDLGSLYGTMVSSLGRKIEAHQWVTLEVGTVIQFGVKNSWMVKWQEIYVLCSAVQNKQEKTKLDGCLVKLGGMQVTAWRDDVTHLVVGEVKFTEKVVDGLLTAKPLVTVDFFLSWVTSLEQNPESPHPDFLDFVPPIHQESLGRFDKQDFLPKEDRKIIFQEKTFVFFTQEQYRSMASNIKKAGGQAIMDSERQHRDGDILVEPNCRRLAEFSARLETIKAQGQRVISMREIMYAIVASSTQRFTNPAVNNDPSFFRTVATRHSSIPAAERTIYAPETQPMEDEISDPVEPPLKRTKIDMTLDLSRQSQQICLDESISFENLDQGSSAKKRETPAPISSHRERSHAAGDPNKSKRKLDEEFPVPSSSTLTKQPVDSPNLHSDVEEPVPKRKKLNTPNQTFSQLCAAQEPDASTARKKSNRDHAEKLDSTKNTTFNETFGHNQTRYRTLHDTSRWLNDSNGKVTVKNLFRPESSFSQVSQYKSLPAKDITPRFRALTLHVRKEGKWTPK